MNNDTLNLSNDDITILMKAVDFYHDNADQTYDQKLVLNHIWNQLNAAYDFSPNK